MEMTKETKLKKSIYTVAVSLPPWYLPVSSLEKKTNGLYQVFRNPALSYKPGDCALRAARFMRIAEYILGV
jgi:hypothetical protein